MTQFDRFERELPVALGDVAGTGAPDYLTDILGRTARTRQRPAWASLERWLPMDLATPRAATARVPWRTLGVLALIALLLATAFALYAGSQRRVPAPFGPAANGLIPYSFDGNILVGDPVTGATRLLVGGPDNDYGPSFSPDGTQVGFLRATADCPQPGDVCPGGEHVVVVGADGRDVRAISSAPLVGIAIVTWAPDEPRAPRRPRRWWPTAARGVRHRGYPAAAPAARGCLRGLGAVPSPGRRRDPVPREDRRHLGPVSDAGGRHRDPAPRPGEDHGLARSGPQLPRLLA